MVDDDHPLSPRLGVREVFVETQVALIRLRSDLSETRARRLLELGYRAAALDGGGVLNLREIQEREQRNVAGLHTLLIAEPREKIGGLRRCKAVPRDRDWKYVGLRSAGKIRQC